ncbi:MAG: hypothetical protein ACJ768_19640 [Gaiellaceae bacterium]
MNASKSFAVPAAAGTYAPEVLYLNVDGDARSLPDQVAELTLAIESLPAGAQLEIDVLKPGLQSNLDASYVLAAKVYAIVGLQTPLALSEWKGVRIRAKSGGAAGAAAAHVSWF